ncbi:MAG: helix-turn-helix transcriptional regulator [Sphingobium sp.]
MNETALALTDRFASVALEPSGWISALQALAEATGSARGQLIGIGGPSTIPFNWVNDFAPEDLEKFIAIEGGSPLVNPRVAVSVGAPVLAIKSESDYRAAEPAMQSDAIADFCREYDFPYGCQAKLVEGDEGIIGLAVLRTEREGPTTEAQRDFFAALAPHVRGAARMQMALENEGARLIAGAMGYVAAAVFICDASGRVWEMTPSAQAFLSEGALCMEDGRLALADRKQQPLLAQAIDRHANGRFLPLESLMIAGGPMRLPMILDVVTAPRQPWTFGFEPKVLVIARGADRWHASAGTVLQSCYGLSPAEADIALRLARGESRQVISDARRASIGTVRSQIKTVFLKLGVTREVDLAIMLGRLFRI